MAPTALYAEPATAVRPCVLVVDDEADVQGLLADTIGKTLNCRLIAAHSIGEAQRILETQTIELMVTDVHLPDGDGTALLPLLRKTQPQASAIVITGSPSVDGAITALRHGAVDFLLKPFSATDISDRVSRALKRQQLGARNERRLDRLKHAVRRLNDARKVVTKKVDLLCNDLITAYGELSRQLDTVRTQEGFKHFLGEMKDLEQLLCHTMDYLMRQMGYCNIAIWLVGDESDFQLGAYMKYTIAGEQDLTDAMKNGVVKTADREGFLRLVGDDVQETLSGPELDYLADQDILATHCTYLGETLAVVVLFRDATKGFVDADAACLKTISPLFAVALASVVRDAQTDDEPRSRDDDEDEEDRGRNSKEDEWWKKGEAPPF